MDIGALASAMIAARIGEVQLAVAAKLIRMDAQAAASAAQLIDAAEANVDRLANVAAGIGANLDVTI
jgi:predicted signal transduction protein with EAL and GGDEF domain